MDVQPAVRDFFISYNQADLPWAEWIAWQLEAGGYSAIIQAWDFRPASNFVLDMQSAAVQAARTIAVLSPDYLAALYTQPEWAAAFAQDPTGEKGTLLPLRVRACELKGLLSPIVHIDLVGRDASAAKQALLAGVKRERAKPATEPDFPAGPPAAPPAKPEPRFPGSLPRIWNVPHRRNPNFTGREDELRELRAALTNGHAAAIVPIAGLGGAGKTRLRWSTPIATPPIMIPCGGCAPKTPPCSRPTARSLPRPSVCPNAAWPISWPPPRRCLRGWAAIRAGC